MALVILGATATGKTDLALRLARALGGEIVGADSVQVLPASPTTIRLAEFAEKMHGAGHPDFSATSFMVRGRVDGHTVTLFADGRAIIKGTTDPSRARAIYDRYVGS